MNPIPLEGCTPEPLMNYLKALGVLKIVVEQDFDSTARACWKNGIFHLHTQLTKEQLLDAFAERYQPSPILSPWNGEGGFLDDKGTGFKEICKLKASTSERLKPIRDAIIQVDSINLLSDLTQLRAREKTLKQKKKKKKLSEEEAEELKSTTTQIKKLKDSVIFKLRGQFPEAALAWLDSCMVVGIDGFKPAPHLGSGGVDGRMEFSVNYITNVMLALDDKRSASWLRDSITGTNKERIIPTSVGQFAPGRIGGANGTQGTEGTSMINPWDFVLMIEGSVFLAGSTNRKLGTSGGSKAVFPFTMNPSPVGMETLTDSDGSKGKGELWLPLWERPSSIGELKQLFSEGRADLNGQQARDGVDFSRAVASLGVDRGIKSFSRQAFLQRNGLSFIATPIGQFEVSAKNDAFLLREIDFWLARFRQACTDKTPARYRALLRETEKAIFDYCQHGDKDGDKSRFQRILISLGNAERLIAKAPKFRSDAKGLRPIGPLSSAWVAAADDGSPEFEIALALASLYHKDVGSLRRNLEPVEMRGKQLAWTDRNHSAVWFATELAPNLAAILYRRVMDADKAGDAAEALRSSHRASLSSVSEFLAGNLDESRITALIWALALCKLGSDKRPRPPKEHGDEPLLPTAYQLLKLIFHPAPPEDTERTSPRPDLGILGLLRADRTPEACQRAVRILRGKSLIAMPFAMRGFPTRDSEWLEHSHTDCTPSTLAAALLISISNSNLNRLRKQMLREKDLA